jgi:signal transduction histidine kinase
MAWITVRRQLAPLRSIGAGVEAFGRGHFDVPIPVSRNDELGDLAQRVNGMARNLSGMLEAKRALLLAISHELRSPLTRARVNAELLEPSGERSALLRDLGEMRDLITQLLESERLASGHSALLPEPTDLAALVHDVVSTQFAGQDLTLDLQPVAGPPAVDAMRMRLLLRNLLANALRHSAGAAQPPQVFVRREADDRIALGVRDHGPDGAALADEQLAQLGQAFYRPDSARTRGGGGVGLGLYLCRLVAQAHGGELRIRRSDPGLEVSAVWPPVRQACGLRPAAQAPFGAAERGL